METKFTPGPWRTRANKKEAPDDCIVMDTEGYSICDCSPGNPKMSVQEAEANARLIAAAPEMAELLEASEAHLADVARDIGIGRERNSLEARGRLAGDMAERIRALLARIEGK